MCRTCVMCGTPIEGKSNKVLCSNACTIKRHRLRKALSTDFREILFTLQSKDELLAMLSKLQQSVEAPIPA